MTAWSDLITTGRGQVIYLLQIMGFRYVLATDTYTCTDSWYQSAGYSALKPWLDWESVGVHSEEIDPLTGHLRVRGISVEVADLDGEMTAEIKSREELSATPLTASLTASATTVSVEDASAYSAGDVCHVGQEAILIGAISVNDLTGCTRGYLGTEAVAHTRDLTTSPERLPHVTTGPVRLAGRRALLRAAIRDATTGTVGAATVIWRGIVGEDIEVGAASWAVPLEHISTVLSRQVGRGLPSTGILPHTYWYDGTSPLSTVRYTVYRDDGTVDPAQYSVTLTGGTYGSWEHLMGAWNEESRAVGTTHRPMLVADLDGTLTLHVPGNADYYATIEIREGDPLWALGFDAGTITQALGADLDREQDDPPRLCTIDLSGSTRSANRPKIWVHDASAFTADLWVVAADGPYTLVDSIDTSDPDAHSITLAAGVIDPVRSERRFIAVAHDAPEDLVIRHVVAFCSHWSSDLDDLEDAAKRAAGLLAGQSEPAEWCLSETQITSDDVDWTELTTALGATPAELSVFSDTLIEPTSWQALIGPRLGLLGVCPRVTDEGKIGWARVETPIALRASAVEVDSDVWDLLAAAEVSARVGGQLVTELEIQYGYDYRSGDWAAPTVLRWHDWQAETGQQRAMTAKLRGLIVSTRIPGLARTRGELDYLIAVAISATHFGLFGRDAVDVEIPCTFTGWQIRCGEVVKITHPLVPDTTVGEIGVTSRLGIVVGRRLPLGRDGTGSLTVRIPPDVHASGIAPCALADSWSLVQLTLTCSGASTPLYAQAGENDLDDLEAVIAAEGNTTIQLWEYDVATPTGSYPLTATATACNASAGTITLSADPFSGGALPADGVEVVWPQWDSQSTSQQAWLSIADTSYGLGSTPDDGYRWGV